MKRRLSFGWLILLVLVALVSVGCNDPSDARAETPLAPTTPATALVATPTGATTTAPTSTTAPRHKTTSESEPDATTASIAANEGLVPDSWNPILAETKAGPVPATATCPNFSIPEVQGADTWPIPYLGGAKRSRAVFDQHAGQVIYHDLERTWAFDVCTNTWTQLQDHDEGALLWLGALVYDIDSDTTVSFGPEKVAVFDAVTGNSTEHAYPSGLHGISAAAYDPVSGLIVATTWEDQLLEAYDVDTNTWHEIGVIPTPSKQDSVELHSRVELLGYSPAMDRFIAVIAELSAWPALPVKIPSGVTLLVDPRTGTTSVISTRSPGYPFNPREDSFRYGATWQTADSAIVDRQGFSLCEFSAETLTWDTCHSPPHRANSIDPDSRIPNRSDTFKPSAIVEDTINDRLLFLALGGYRVPHIWEHDQKTNEWTHIPFAVTE
jgi:hypothetical protein